MRKIMRKLFLAFVMFGCLTVNANTILPKYNFKNNVHKTETASDNKTIRINVEKLGDYLELSAYQYDNVAEISKELETDVRRANFTKGKKRSYRKAFENNFKSMQRVLNKEQYQKYCEVLKVTLENKGIEIDDENGEK